jgi:hypothetical protein
VTPALLPRLRLRLLALIPAAVLALHAALGVWILHPLRLLGRFGHGFLEFYDVKLPFAAAVHPRMEAVLLVALFASCAVVAQVIAARRPVLASLAVIVTVGWGSTLVTGPDDLKRGVALLAVVLSLVVGLGERPHPRRLALAAIVGGAVLLASFAASTSSAVASGQVLHWQGWDFYTKPPKPVGVEYVWNSNYTGLHFPKKVTPVLTIKAPRRPTYWRATTLDEFDGGSWFENNAVAVAPTRIDGRDELSGDPQLPAAARDQKHWVRQDVTVRALRDDHLIGAAIPAAYAPGSLTVDYTAGGVANLQGDPLSGGDHYTVWSYEPRPTPRQLADRPDGAALPGLLPRPAVRGLLRDREADRRRHVEPVRGGDRARRLVPERRLPLRRAPSADRKRGAARRVRDADAARVLPALRGRDGAHAPLPRDPGAGGGRLHERRVRPPDPRMDSHRPRCTHVGRGVVPALWLGSV